VCNRRLSTSPAIPLTKAALQMSRLTLETDPKVVFRIGTVASRRLGNAVATPSTALNLARKNDAWIETASWDISAQWAVDGNMLDSPLRDGAGDGGCHAQKRRWSYPNSQSGRGLPRCQGQKMRQLLSVFHRCEQNTVLGSFHKDEFRDDIRFLAVCFR